MGIKLLFSTTCHPQTDGQTEVTNCTLTTLLRGMVSKSLRDWDSKLPCTEFAYNRTPSYATSHSPFEVCYGLNLLTSLDLIPISQESKVSFEAEERAKAMKKLYEKVRAQIDKANEQYKAKANKNQTHLEFKLEDLVWLHLRKERSPSRRKASSWQAEMALTRSCKEWEIMPTR